MSLPHELTDTWHNFETLLAGKSSFNEFISDEGKMIEGDIAKLAPAIQPAAQVMYASLKAGASALVGVGLTVAGPILAESTETQATQLLNLLSALGVPTGGPLSVAELAMLQTAINGLKANLDKIGLSIATSPAPAKAMPAAAPAPAPVSPPLAPAAA